MVFARSFVNIPEFFNDGVLPMNDTSLSCTVSKAGTCVNKIGSVDKDEIDGRLNDACG